jgi:tRNA modification GTPase
MSQSLFYSTLTPKGRGAIAVIAVCGPNIDEAIDACFSPVANKPVGIIKHDIIYGIWNSTGEDLLVVRSGPDQYEIQCHGSQAVIDAITFDLQSQAVAQLPTGANVVGAEEESVALKFRSEIEVLLNHAKTERTALLLLNQWKLLPESADQLDALEPAERHRTINTMLSHASFGLNFHRTRSVVFCGRPNAGKSSLINRVLGFQRAIVNPMPGTTRDVVSEGSAVDGWPVEFSDTAGLRETDGKIEKMGIEKAEQMIESADVVSGVVDGVDPDLQVEFAPDIVVINKSDLVDGADLKVVVENVSSRFPQAICLTTSATTGAGIEELLAAVAKVLCPKLPPTDQAYPVTQAQVDWLREKL